MLLYFFGVYRLGGGTKQNWGVANAALFFREIILSFVYIYYKFLGV